MERNHAIKHLMRRLSDIVFAMMRDLTPYDSDVGGSSPLASEEGVVTS